MNEIICPHCGKAFKIDKSGYSEILKQVRNREFDKQLHGRLDLAEQEKRNAVELAQAVSAGELQKIATAKDAEIQELKAKLDAGNVAQKLAVTEALSAVEKQRDALANELEQRSRIKTLLPSWPRHDLRTGSSPTTIGSRRGIDGNDASRICRRQRNTTFALTS